MGPGFTLLKATLMGGRDTTAPTLVITTAATDTVSEPFPITIKSYNGATGVYEDVYGLTIDDLTVTNGSASDWVEVSGHEYTATITPTLTGMVSVQVTGAYTDAAENAGTASNSLALYYDPLWPSPVLYDWTDDANTAYGTAGVEGDASQGIPGWTPAKTNVWKIVSGAAAFTSSTTHYTDALYLATHLRLNDRFAIQGNQSAAIPYYTFGVGYNPTTGEGYYVAWNQGATPYVTIRRLTGTGSYPATGFWGRSRVNLTYSGGQANDWAVLERVVIGQTSKLRVSICPNLNNHPDYGHPRVTQTYYDTYAPLVARGYPFISSCQSGYNLSSPRFELTEAPREFSTDVYYFGKGKTIDIALVGTNTNWTEDSIFTASAGVTINTITVTDATHSSLNVTTGSFNKTVTITEPGGATQNILVSTYAISESRYIYGNYRITNSQKIPALGGPGAVTFSTSSGSYGVGFSLDGDYVYILNQTNILKYNLAGELQATITYTGINNVRKMLTLPDGTYVVSNYGAHDYRHLAADDSYIGVWNTTAIASCYGLCLLYDAALARNTVLTAGWALFDIKQWELDGTLIKTWATGIPGQCSDVAVDSDGNVYAADWTNGAILLYNNTGTYLGTPITGLSAPHDLTVLQDETLLVAEETIAHLSAWGPGGTCLNTYFGGVTTNVGVKVYPLPAPTPA
jgi:hypothetical protein